MTSKSGFHRTFDTKTRAAVIQGSAGLVGAIIGGLIVALANITVNSWIIPAVEREQKHIDRQYESLEQVARIGSDGISNLWNGFYAIRGKDPTGNRYRDQFQKAESEGYGLKVKFPILFQDQTIAEDWDAFITGLRNISQSLGRMEITTDEDMVKRLAPVVSSLETVENKIRSEIN